METLYEILLGRPRGDEGAGDAVAGTWAAADGEGPDRLFNRYRRLRLAVLAEAGSLEASLTAAPRCPALPTAARA